jgi:hypothetical protein
VLLLIRAGACLLVIAAIVAQALELASHDRFDATRFFAYFTIQSNLVGVVALGWLAIRGPAARARGVELVRGAAAVYLTVTFFVVIALLSNIDVGLQLVWVDIVLHKLFPVVVVLDWILDPPAVRLSARDAALWIAYPLIWTGFTLTRGAADGWYPYPFLDPANGGYGQVAIVVAAITAGFVLISLALIAIGNARRPEAPATG